MSRSVSGGCGASSSASSGPTATSTSSSGTVRTPDPSSGGQDGTVTTLSAPLLVCCGLVTLDVLQFVDRLPAPDEKIVATELAVGFGGPAANAAATAVALGVRTRLVPALGSGAVADLVRTGLSDTGIELVDLLDGAPGTPAVSTVLVTRATGERAVVSVNATGTDDLSARARELAADALTGASVLLLDGHHLGPPGSSSCSTAAAGSRG